MSLLRILTIGLVAVLAAALGCAGVSYALWSSQATASSTVQAGAVGVTLTGGESLAVTYSASTLVNTGSLTVGNAGSVSSNYTTVVTLGAGASAALASAVQVAVWPSPGTCAATAPSSASTGTWASAPALSGTLAAGASATWCVRTSVTAAQVTANPNTQVAPTFTATASVGTWGATAATGAVQGIAPPAAPTVPQIACAVSGIGVNISWTEPAGTAYSLYEVWIGGIKFANGNSNDRTEYIGWSGVVPTHGANGSKALVEIKKTSGTGQGVVASGFVTPSTVQYQYYSQNVMSCG